MSEQQLYRKYNTLFWLLFAFMILLMSIIAYTNVYCMTHNKAFINACVQAGGDPVYGIQQMTCVKHSETIIPINVTKDTK